ncbi:SoxR reducing system RseC family protein [Vibrio sp.]|uniref:SoxR reducing system RseC family protein n=1 Tax=Vibrio sp. TaxID=678 RepID=UPI003D0AD25E
MMTALATVASVSKQRHGYQLELDCQQQTSCSSCASQKSCGTGVVSKAIGNRNLHWSLNTDQPVKVGQVVEIGLPERSLLQSAALVYLLPLIMLMMGAGLASTILAPWLNLGEGIVILAAFASAAAGVLMAKRWSSRLEQSSRQQVVLVRVLGEPIS